MFFCVYIYHHLKLYILPLSPAKPNSPGIPGGPVGPKIDKFILSIESKKKKMLID